MAEVTELVDKAKGGFEALSGAVETAKGVAPVLLQMLGADGQTRNYLVVAENNNGRSAPTAATAAARASSPSPTASGDR